jgi:hypothetical protein
MYGLLQRRESDEVEPLGRSLETRRITQSRPSERQAQTGREDRFSCLGVYSILIG